MVLALLRNKVKICSKALGSFKSMRCNGRISADSWSSFTRFSSISLPCSVSNTGSENPLMDRPVASTQVWNSAADGLCRTGPSSCDKRSRKAFMQLKKSDGRRPSYVKPSHVRPIVTSGCENSLASDGTSLPTKGTAQSLRDAGTPFALFIFSGSNPNDTLSIFVRMKGNVLWIQSRPRFRNFISLPMLAVACRWASRSSARM
mmetsp:Transcript_10253/g.22129  ORF Transcript_10253/g.22129 Transcript_10253/m.22129 type:complete len:203 (+) Transcript_10253:3332-3940(+)